MHHRCAPKRYIHLRCRHIGRHTNSPRTTWLVIAADWNASQFARFGHRSSNRPDHRRTIWYDHCQHALETHQVYQGCFPRLHSNANAEPPAITAAHSAAVPIIFFIFYLRMDAVT